MPGFGMFASDLALRSSKENHEVLTLLTTSALKEQGSFDGEAMLSSLL